MTSLSRDLLETIRADRKVVVGPPVTGPERIIQIGEGNFLRAFVDSMVDRANAQGVFGGRIVVVQPRNRKQGTVATLQQQGGLYTVLVRGRADGQTVDRAELVTSISRGINPYTQWAEFLACATNPDLRFLVSNTTEAGVVYEAEAQPRFSFGGRTFPFLISRSRHSRLI